jgi:tmRNA-binding protein
MNDLEREMLYDERNKKRKLLLEKYELLKITRAQQQNKDLVFRFGLFILL